jgi:ankyrin repeat protein
MHETRCAYSSAIRDSHVYRTEVNKTDAHGATALYMAVEHDKPRVVRELLDFGANPNTKTRVYIDGPDNETPLHRAGSKYVYQLLLDHGADASAKDSTGETLRNLLNEK